MKWWITIAVAIASAPLIAGQARAPGVRQARAPGVRQAPAPGVQGVVLSGVVIDDADGRALAGVHITVRMTPDALAPVTRTGSDGRFELMVQAPRQHQLVARKAGYEPTVLVASPATPLVVRMPGGAAVAGRVVDDAGEPVVGATVRVVSRQGDTLRTTVTDDRGEYRLSVRPDLPVFVTVTTTGVDTEPTGTGGRIRFSTPEHTTYYPGADRVEDATPIVVMPAQLSAGIDFAVPTLQSVRQPHGAFDAIPILNLFVPDRAVSDAASVVQGRVVDTEDRGVANALVAMTNERGGSGVRLARSDAAGNFEFGDVFAGSTRVMAWKPGYASDDRRPVVASAPARPTQVELRLTPWAAIEGRVVDEFGDPVQDVQVQVLRTTRVRGPRQFTPAPMHDPVTDDRGHYRVSGLAPGTYVVRAQRDGARTSALAGYAPSFYTSGAAGGRAQIITLLPGTSIGDVDIGLARTSTHRIVGRIVGEGDQPPNRGALQLWASVSGESGLAVPPILASQLAGGEFEFTNLLDGTYVVQAYRGRLNSTTEGEFGATTVTVSGADVTNVAVTTSIGSDLAGSIVFESANGPREPSRADIELTPVPADLDAAPNGNWATAGVGPDWRFAMAGISGARRLAATRLPPGWTVKAIHNNGVDITDMPIPLGSRQQSLSDIQVLLSDRVTRLTGRVVDGRGQGVAEMPILVFAPERGRWYPFSRYLRTATTTSSGSFMVEGMPPGSYYVAIVPASSGQGVDDVWQDPAGLEALISAASLVTMVEGQSSSIVIRR